MDRSAETVLHRQTAVVALSRRHGPVAVLKVLPTDGHDVVPQQLPQGLLAVRAGLALIRDADGRRSRGRRLEGCGGGACPASSAGRTLGRGQEGGADQQDAEEKGTRPPMDETTTTTTHEVQHPPRHDLFVLLCGIKSSQKTRDAATGTQLRRPDV